MSSKIIQSSPSYGGWLQAHLFSGYAHQLALASAHWMRVRKPASDWLTGLKPHEAGHTEAAAEA